MAEAMVQIRPATPADEDAGEGVGDTATALPVADTLLPLVARRLAELTRTTLECRCVSIAAVETPTGLLHPVIEVGLPPEQEQAWWASWAPLQSVEERYGATIAASLYAGQTAGLALEHHPKRSWNTLYQVQTGHILRCGWVRSLWGRCCWITRSTTAYSSAEEMLLTETLARLGALVLERDRLLRGWAEARANELALGETKAQMDTFLGIVSHELRTPLTSLKLSLQVAERRLRRLVQSKNAERPGRDDGLQPAVEQLSRTAHQVGRLERLVNDLVDISRIQASKLDLRLDRADLVVIVREVVEAQQQAAPERTIRLLCPADLSVPMYADAGRIEQVVTNYLTNALKYSRADHPVDVGVAVEPEERQVRVWVRDQGPGLPVEEGAHLGALPRASEVDVHSGAGVGLGLALYI
jgi:signal transduction histidine kinase